MLSAQARYNIKNKLLALQHYSANQIPFCQICGIIDIDVLTIDHISQNGSISRKTLKCGSGYNFYIWLKQQNYPDGFRVLCLNHNRLVWLNHIRKQSKAKYASNHRRKIKIETLSHYGDLRCSNCGEPHIDLLTLDHINNDGQIHRNYCNSMSNHSIKGNEFYIWLRKEGYPNDPPLQILCWNCQLKKRIQKCPTTSMNAKTVSTP